MPIGGGGSGDWWRWDPGQHRQWTGKPTITVSEPNDEDKKERQRKIDAGAQVIPFGFARALVERIEEPVVDPADEAWEGQGL